MARKDEFTEAEGWEVVRSLLSRPLTNPKDDLDRLLQRCAELAPSSVWATIDEGALVATVGACTTWLHRVMPTVDPSISVLWFATGGVPQAIQLRGVASWSGDVEDWDWWFHADSLSEPLECAAAREGFELTAEVPRVEDVFAFVFIQAWLAVTVAHAVRACSPAVMLNGCEQRDVTVGIPGQGFGLILGEISRDGWKYAPRLPTTHT